MSEAKTQPYKVRDIRVVAKGFDVIDFVKGDS